MSKAIYLTNEGLEKLQKELNELKVGGRKKIADQIREAREKGDLSENAEYDAAKEAQGLLELKIAKLETMLSNARVLDKTQIDTSKVTALCVVKIKNIENDKEFTYHLVAESEADIKQNKISVTSPIGNGLLGKSVGEIVKIIIPSGELEFKILSISS